MDKLQAMATFVRIVDRGSLTAAGESLRSSLPSVVRTLAALEAALDVRLINRTTRRMALTDEGREYYARCQRVLADIDDAEAALSARRAVPKGRLRVTAPVMFGRMHVAPVITEFIAKYPAVRVELILLDRVVDLMEEGLDVAVRVGHLPDSSLVALPIGETCRVVCASPAYLKRAGTPVAIADLAAHRCLTFGGITPGDEWTFATGGKATRVTITPALASNQIDPVLDACVQGAGLGQFLSYQVAALLETRALKRVLAEFEPLPLPIHAIYPSARLLSSNVRALVDWAVPRLRARVPNAKS
jgi:DNA-binding transcriptional LysR family regulator